MIHASVELVQACGGVAPFEEFERHCSDAQSCGGRRGDVVWARIGIGEAVEPPHDAPIDCAQCIANLRSAIGPARLAQLEVEADRLHGVIAAWQQAEAECVRCPRCRGKVSRVPGGVDCAGGSAGGCYFGFLPSTEQMAELERRDWLQADAEAAQKWLTAFRALVPATVGEATAADQSADSAPPA